MGHALGVTAELGMADLLADGPRSIGDLAAATDTHAPSLARLVRALAAMDVARETSGGAVELTPLGATVRTSVGGWIREAFGERNRRARGDLLESLRTGEPAIDRLYRESVFESWQTDPEALARSNASFRASASMFAELLVDTYDLSTASCIVDVGGNIAVDCSARFCADFPRRVGSCLTFRTSSPVGNRCSLVLASWTAAPSQEAISSHRYPPVAIRTSCSVSSTTGTTRGRA
jgi:hypothetical protein